MNFFLSCKPLKLSNEHAYMYTVPLIGRVDVAFIFAGVNAVIALGLLCVRRVVNGGHSF